MNLPKPPRTTAMPKPALPPRFRCILRALLFPPGIAVAAGILATAALMYWTLGLGHRSEPASYAAYVASAYVATVACAYAILRHPVRRASWLLRKSRRLSRLMDDREHRASAGVQASLAVDLFWAGANFALGALHDSPWFSTLAAYYLLLFAMRLTVVRHVRRDYFGGNLRGELRAQLTCGVLLTLSIFTLASAVIMVVRDEGGFVYAGNLIYAIALYAFYSFVAGIVNFAKFRTHASPALATTMGINLAVALVSLFSLEAAMVSAFGSADDEASRFAMTVATGAFVGIAVTALGASMTRRAGSALRSMRAQAAAGRRAEGVSETR